MVYVSVVALVFGLWLLGERVWVVGGAIVNREWPSHFGSMVARFAVIALVTLTLLRVPNAVASPMPPSERLVLEYVSADEATPAPLVPSSGRVLSAPVRAMTQEPESVYTVAPGDCLWRIARSMLERSGSSRPSGDEVTELWTEIYRINRDLIGHDPNLIHPGQVLVLPER